MDERTTPHHGWLCRSLRNCRVTCAAADTAEPKLTKSAGSSAIAGGIAHPHTHRKRCTNLRPSLRNHRRQCRPIIPTICLNNPELRGRESWIQTAPGHPYPLETLGGGRQYFPGFGVAHPAQVRGKGQVPLEELQKEH